MTREFQLDSGIRHDITVGKTNEIITVHPEIGELRAQEEYTQIGRVQTDMGAVDMYKVEFGELTQESADSLESFTEKSRPLGEEATRLIVASPFAVMGAKLSGFDINPESSPVALGWPAMIQRNSEERSSPNGALRIGTLPPTPSSRPQLDQGLIAHYRNTMFEDELPYPALNRSPDPLTFADKPLAQDEVIQPIYLPQELGVAQPGNTQVAYERLGPIDNSWWIQISSLTIVHSRALLALMLSSHSSISHSEAAHIAMPYTARDQETHQKTGVVGAVAIYGPETLERYRAIF